MPKLETVKNYFRSIETGDLEGLVNCYHPEVIQIELPNLIKAQGDRRSLSEMKRDFARGAKLLKSQSYEIISLAEQDNRVVVEVLWRGVLAVPVKNLREGDEMKAHSAIFFEFQDSLIVSQKNYDCFEPF